MPKRLEVGPDYVNNLVQLVQAKGCKPERLYDQAGLAYNTDEEADEQPLDAPGYSRLYSEATRVVGDECFGFLGPGRIPCGTLSVFCEYLLPAHTLGEALERASSFFNWMQKLQHRNADIKAHVPYSSSENVATLFFINQSSNLSSVFISQRAIASALSSWLNFLAWLIRKPLPLLDVQLQGRCQLDEERYRRIFKAPLRYQQAHNACRVSADLLKAPVQHNQQTLEEFLRLAPYHLVGSSERDSSAYSISSKIKQLLGDDFSRKPPGVDKTAKLLSIPPNALRRGLEREGTSFAMLKEEAHLEATIRLLGDGALNLDEIAVRMGFEDPNALNRGFKKWTGLTARQYREQIGCE